ncbi:MAG: LysM peptidoglycan-binding domain-containing protein [Treponema sp.]|nr:LysM peptidoglycan-binding domain-containing protein [Treponema sp.]
MLVCVLVSGLLSAEDLIHVVVRGETVFSISRSYQVTESELMRANNITDPSTLQVGRRLVIPASSPRSVSGSSIQPGGSLPVVQEAPVNPAQISVQTGLADYRVIRGDTFYSIARAHGISVQNLLDLNRFSANHVIKIGDVIKVPGRVTPSVIRNPETPASGLYALRWPVMPKDISYMTGQMGVVVEAERAEVVRSLTQGSVVSASPWRKFGRVVIVETTGGYYYMYGGLETINVTVGERITPGMDLGRLGVNAVSEKPQLFFMVFQRDKPIDPAAAPRA